MTTRSRASPLRRALLLAFACVALAALRHECHAFSSPRSSVSGAGTVARGRLFGSATDVGGGARPDVVVRGARPDIVVLRSREDYDAFLACDERLCVVKFHAHWCKSCQRFGVKFRHLAFDAGDRLDRKGAVVRAGEVRFAELEYSASAALCKSLNIKKLPTVHMYRQGEQVVDMVCKPSLFHLVVDEVHRQLEGANPSPLLTPEREPAFAVGGDGNDAAFDELADEIRASWRKDEEEAATEKEKEKSSWFPFTF